jgi:hypothetical protein
MEKDVWSVEIDETGIVRILHICGCRNCGSWGYAFINMAYVGKDDYLQTVECPTCHQEAIYIITYTLLAEYRKDQDDDSGEI